MHRIAFMLALVALGTLATTASATTHVSAKPSTVGGGVKNPWTGPYTFAIVTVPEPTTLGVLGLGAAALVLRRRGKR
jgi:hypothetical protein